MGILFLLQGIFPTQGSNPGLPHCGQIPYQLSLKGLPRILEWVAYTFFCGSSQPRNWTAVSCIAGGFFTNWAIREAQEGPCTRLNIIYQYGFFWKSILSGNFISYIFTMHITAITFFSLVFYKTSFLWFNKFQEYTPYFFARKSCSANVWPFLS